MTLFGARAQTSLFPVLGANFARDLGANFPLPRRIRKTRFALRICDGGVAAADGKNPFCARRLLPSSAPFSPRADSATGGIPAQDPAHMFCDRGDPQDRF